MPVLPHLSCPALWMVAVPNSQLVFAGKGVPARSIELLIVFLIRNTVLIRDTCFSFKMAARKVALPMRGRDCSNSCSSYVRLSAPRSWSWSRVLLTSATPSTGSRPASSGQAGSRIRRSASLGPCPPSWSFNRFCNKPRLGSQCEATPATQALMTELSAFRSYLPLLMKS